MKQLFTVSLFVAMLALLATPSVTLAQTGTLVVYASSTTTTNGLDKIIGRDTLAGGAQAHAVYSLVSRDTTYIYNGAITVKSNLSVIGVLGSDGRPPCIQPAVLGDGSIPVNLFVLNGRHTVATFKNLYLLGLSLNNSANLAGVGIQVSADSIKVYVDNCVFEEWLGFAIGYNSNWDSFFITNSKFRNMNHPNQWYVGEVLRNEWPGAAYTDSIVMRYNTVLCVNGYAAAPVTKYYERYFEFSHNSVIYTFKNPFFIFNVTKAKINDNIFYGAWSGAISKTEYPWWDQLWTPEVGSIIDMDRLDSSNAAIVLGHASTGFGDPAAELLRTVEVKNNVNFWPAAVTAYWTAWNDTAHVDSIYRPTWMNTRTTNMFTNKTLWPGFVQTGNQSVDPGFGASIGNVLNAGRGYGIGLLNWFKQCRTGTLSTDVWGYQITSVGTAANWVPPWPLPETQDMKYTNASLKTAGTDGRPLGDPWWFNGSNGGPTGVSPISGAIPSAFALSPAYPNPFNPSTNLHYTLSKSGIVNLRVYNLLGQVVATIVNNENQIAGTYIVRVDMARMGSGVYFAVLEQGTNRAMQKLMLLK